MARVGVEQQERVHIEVKKTGTFVAIAKGAYNSHNFAVKNLQDCKRPYEYDGREAYLCLPFGGGFSSCGDFFAAAVYYVSLLTWIIPAVLAYGTVNRRPSEELFSKGYLDFSFVFYFFLSLYHVAAFVIICINWNTFNNAWYMIEVNDLVDSKNEFFEVTASSARSLTFLHADQQNFLLARLEASNDVTLGVMAYTSAYTRDQFTVPAIQLFVFTALSIMSAGIQFGTLANFT
uniref:Uncharacterized protein n=1 Tax=Branchiostoma floridae TaxID=7739 RepID=C3ZLV6_BRAFL|eukprot:XP_002590426.1 hypothetical protein BRAFLDRAFT_109719 [Branchiostoma floridae]